MQQTSKLSSYHIGGGASFLTAVFLNCHSVKHINNGTRTLEWHIGCLMMTWLVILLPGKVIVHLCKAAENAHAIWGASLNNLWPIMLRASKSLEAALHVDDNTVATLGHLSLCVVFTSVNCNTLCQLCFTFCQLFLPALFGMCYVPAGPKCPICVLLSLFSFCPAPYWHRL